MKKLTLSTSVFTLLASTALAGGLDRSGQGIGAVFNAPGTTGVSFGVIMPSIKGIDNTGNSYDIGETYQQYGFSYTGKATEKFSYALIVDQPYGVNVSYGNNPTTSALGGTMADLSSQSATFVGRYALTSRFSVLGGISVESVKGTVALNGVSYRNAISTAAVVKDYNENTRPSGTPELEVTTLGAALQNSLPAVATDAATAIDTAYGAGTTAALGAGVTTQSTAFATNGGYNFSMEDDTSVGFLLGAA